MFLLSWKVSKSLGSPKLTIMSMSLKQTKVDKLTLVVQFGLLNHEGVLFRPDPGLILVKRKTLVYFQFKQLLVLRLAVSDYQKVVEALTRILEIQQSFKLMFVWNEVESIHDF